MDSPTLPFELIAQGAQHNHRWRRRLPGAGTIELGRATPSFRVPWDAQISRRHVTITIDADHVNVTTLPNAKNPVFLNGTKVTEFDLKPNDHFVIGNTSFTLSHQQAEATLNMPDPIHQKSFSPDYLNQVKFRDAEQRIDVLSRLPDLISSAGNQTDLLNRLVTTLFAGIESASRIGIVQWQRSSPPPSENPAQSEARSVTIIHWDHRGVNRLSMTQNQVEPISLKAGTEPKIVKHGENGFQPSETLIRKSVESGESILHIWQSNLAHLTEYTFDSENDWAFVCPLDSPATPGWCIYVTGSQSVNSPTGTDDALPADQERQGDIKFCELVGTTLKNLLLVNRLERQQASFRGFFSPVVMEAIMHRDPDKVLEPQECQISVIFCDLKGFVKTTESMADELFRLLEHVSQSLEVVTRQIRDHGGVIGDFHGDAVMGFWGWPLQEGNTATRALKTALAIKAEYNRKQPDQARLPVGIGVATGFAVAGKIGTRDQVKVTALGPVVNLASRLESLNRKLNTSILLDQATLVQHQEEATSMIANHRSLGKFLPSGIYNPVEIFELTTNVGSAVSMHDSEFADAIARFQSGDWEQAAGMLSRLNRDDNACQFFLDYIQDRKHPPENWNGVVKMQAK